MKNGKSVLAKTAKAIATQNVNTACFGWLYQPKISPKLKQLKNK